MSLVEVSQDNILAIISISKCSHGDYSLINSKILTGVKISLLDLMQA